MQAKIVKDCWAFLQMLRKVAWVCAQVQPDLAGQRDREQQPDLVLRQRHRRPVPHLPGLPVSGGGRRPVPLVWHQLGVSPALHAPIPQRCADACMTNKELLLTVSVPQERISHQPDDHCGQPSEPLCLLMTRLRSKNDTFLSLEVATRGACSPMLGVDLSAALAALRSDLLRLLIPAGLQHQRCNALPECDHLQALD